MTKTFHGGKVRAIRSGTDWEGISCITLQVDRRTTAGVDGPCEAIVQSLMVEQIADMPRVTADDPAVPEDNSQCLAECLRGIHQQMGSVVRSRESNLGIMLSDKVRAFYAVDAGLVNSGNIRPDKVAQATVDTNEGLPLAVRDLIEMLPFNNTIVVKRIAEDVLLCALENTLSDIHISGRFLEYSGFRVAAD
ncbi:hypothetical protein PG985_010926 [Apiospora marii]|uniref:5'-Nucleotidase C-terminal domain-containing protein n=1 Tax=Apiospora marii TaxID=335849 RepID=A0ABR1T2C8_9PEZI